MKISEDLNMIKYQNEIKFSHMMTEIKTKECEEWKESFQALEREFNNFKVYF